MKNYSSAGFPVPLPLLPGVDDHKMRLKRQLRFLSERIYNGGPEGEIGNETPVHHVHVNVINSPAVFPDFFAHTAEIV